MLHAIEYLESFGDDQPAALRALEFLQSQVCYLGGRLLSPVNQIGRDCWRVQTFHCAAGVTRADVLPQGCALRVIPNGQRRALGIV